LQDNDGQQPVPPQAQQQMAQQDQMIQKLMTAVHRMSAQLEAQQVQSASKERIALINARAGILEAALKAKSQEAMLIFEKDLEQIDRQIALIPDPALGEEAGDPNAGGAASSGPAAPAPVQQQPTPMAAQPQIAA
jgi:hypothetical protein